MHVWLSVSLSPSLSHALVPVSCPWDSYIRFHRSGRSSPCDAILDILSTNNSVASEASCLIYSPYTSTYYCGYDR